MEWPVDFMAQWLMMQSYKSKLTKAMAKQAENKPDLMGNGMPRPTTWWPAQSFGG